MAASCQSDPVRAVVQRVLRASVTVDGDVVGAVDGPGLLVYLGVTHTDGQVEVAWLARKVWELRILRDDAPRPRSPRRSW
jgi:D-tyrosyl-tRNA(Tyr) deacylase